MPKKRMIALVAGLLLAGSLADAQEKLRPLQLDAGIAKLPFTFAAYGDIRFTDPSDARRQSASDVPRRQLLVQKIAALKPAFLVIGGDLVTDGSNLADWGAWDQETQPLRQAGIPIFPTLGNHDLRGGEAGLTNYFQHFPALSGNRWYTLRAQNCLFLMLDTNNATPGSEQWNWLAAELAHVPAKVKFIFVVQHHPGMTQSCDNMPPGEGMGGGGHSLRPQEVPLAELLEAARARLNKPIVVLAGHVHNYEHYERNGVIYITTGGGGATPYRIERHPDDAYHEPGPTYHFCFLHVRRNRVKFTMNKVELADGQAQWTVGDLFTIKAGAARKAAGK